MDIIDEQERNINQDLENCKKNTRNRIIEIFHTENLSIINEKSKIFSY
jgi:hypothetical protein